MNFYNENIEKALLSSIIFDPNVLEEIAELEESDFYVPFYRKIYKSITKLNKAERPIDEEFIKQELEADRVFDEDNFLDVLATSPVANIKEYAKEIKRLKAKRDVYLLSNKIREELKSGEELDSVISYAQKLEDIDTGFELQGEKLSDIVPKDAEFYNKDFLPIPVGTLSMISAPGGTGKSWLALQIALRFALAHPNKKVFLWLSEDNNSISKSRAVSIYTKILEKTAALPENIIIYDKSPLNMFDKRKVMLNQNFYKVKRALKEYDFIVFDPLLAFFGGNENDNGEARVFMQGFMNWASAEGKAIIFLHHSTKPDDSGYSRSRGASAIVDAVRVCYEMSKVVYKEGNKIKPIEAKLHIREIRLTKDNYGALQHIEGFKIERQILPRLKQKEVEIVYKENKIELPEIL